MVYSFDRISSCNELVEDGLAMETEMLLSAASVKPLFSDDEIRHFGPIFQPSYQFYSESWLHW